MAKTNQTEALLALIREGKPMSGRTQLYLIMQLSIPAILAQVTNVMMFFIDQAMVGSLGAEASAACGLIESTTWLFGGIASAASMGFSVQVAHFIGANDFTRARQVVRHGLICTSFMALLLLIGAWIISPHLPYWLGGGDDIAADASTYFLIFAFGVPFFQLNTLASSMLKCEGRISCACGPHGLLYPGSRPPPPLRTYRTVCSRRAF